MKHGTRFAVACTALYGLLFAAGVHATDVSTKPLKAEALIKPNVIFAWDDSGSMDWNIMMDGTNSGILWWDAGTGRAYSAAGQPNAWTDDYPLTYLFPMSGTGGDNYAYNNYYGLTAPPTAQFAAVRSHVFNPLYYNHNITYQPWAPAYYSGADQTFPNATPTAARAHPAVTGSVTMDLTTNRTTGNIYVQQGMRRPDNTLAPGLELRNYTYYPATYWVLDTTCTVDNANVNSNCVNTPDGTQRLRRVEIRAANTFPSGRSYTDEMQNFANWFSYYRKRRLMAAAAMGSVLDNLTGMRVGYVKFNNQSPATMYDTDVASNANGRVLAGNIYTSTAGGGTPTGQALNYIGNQYLTNNAIITSSCQRNNAFVVTDGFANGGTITPPAYNPAPTNSNVWPYQTTTSGWIADIALSYYANNLRNGRAFTDGRVPTGDPAARNPDLNTNLHMNTYALSLGLRGSVWPMPAGQDPWTNPFTWPAPASDMPSALDDLYHATINGRGRMYLATDPIGTALGIQDGLNDMLDNVGAQSSVAVSSVNLRRGDGKAYLGVYNPKRWSGDVTANTANPSTGQISTTPLWSAATRLAARNWTTRVVATFNGSTGVPFTAANIGNTVNPGGIYGSNAAVVDYLRGDRTGENTVPITFRRRTSLISAVINARPVVSQSDGVVYAASSEGMVHALDANTGDELWAYVPGSALSEMGGQTRRTWNFETFLDGSPQLFDVGGRRILIGGRGAAGTGYYALDVTSPRSITSDAALSARVMWEYQPTGLAVGKPIIVMTSTGPVALVTQGYSNPPTTPGVTDGRGRLHMLNALTGALIHTFDADARPGDTLPGIATTNPGLAQVTAAVESTGLTIHVYGGDERGNLWKFDLEARNTPAKVAVLRDASNNRQPITAAPAIVRIGTNNVLLVGTGRLLGVSDLNGSSAVQSFYAIKDNTPTELPGRGSLIAHVLSAQDGAGERDLAGPNVDWNSQLGWYFDLPAGQQANTDPSVVLSAVAFTTNMAAMSDCSASSYLYVVDIMTGLNVAAHGNTPGMAYAAKRIGDFTVSAVTPLGFDGRGTHDIGFGFQRSTTRDTVPPNPDMNCQGSTCVPPGSIPTGVDSRKNSWRQINR